MRSFERCLPALHWHVFRHFPGAEFYVSTVKDENATKATLLRDRYPGARVEIEVVKEQPEFPLPPGQPGWKLGGFYTHEPYAISVHPQAVLRQLWQLEQVWKLYATSNVIPAGGAAVHDLVIRCRPDLYFQSSPFSFFTKDDFPEEHEALTPWWGRFGGVNDRFALLGAEAAEAYFTTFSQRETLINGGCPLHPESLIKAAVEEKSGECSPLAVEFSTLRENGEMRAPEISAIDLAHMRA